MRDPGPSACHPVMDLALLLANPNRATPLDRDQAALLVMLAMQDDRTERIGEHLRERRMISRMSREDLAERLAPGDRIDAQALGLIEDGVLLPTPGTLARLLAVLRPWPASPPPPVSKLTTKRKKQRKPNLKTPRLPVSLLQDEEILALYQHRVAVSLVASIAGVGEGQIKAVLARVAAHVSPPESVSLEVQRDLVERMAALAQARQAAGDGPALAATQPR